MQITINDRASYAVASQREYTDEGFLRVPGYVARTGIQDYLAVELGLDGDPHRIVKIYRPPEEVFDSESLASYDGVDVTINHPKGLVTADNFKTVSAGVVRGSGIQDGDFIKCNLIVKDKDAIAAINSGKSELSAGYSSICEDTAGVTAGGQSYDFIQRKIRINHVALVDRARAGMNARIFDHSSEAKQMTHKVMLDSGRSVEVSDEATALLVSDTIERLTKQVADATAEAEKAKAVADATNEKLTELKTLSSDEAIANRVKAIADAQTAARSIAGESFACDSVVPVDIMRAALAVARPKIAWGDKSADYVVAAFDMCAAAEKDEGDDKEKVSKDQMAQLAQDAAANKIADSASLMAKRKAEISQSWKGAK
jgi:hypothetical protein